LAKEQIETESVQKTKLGPLRRKSVVAQEAPGKKSSVYKTLVFPREKRQGEKI